MSGQREVIVRPNGKPYRPRKVTAYIVGEDDDFETTVVVLGTHDIDCARALADDAFAYYVESGYRVTDPVLVWWRDGMENGRRMWLPDTERGRAGVWFRETEAR